MRRPTQIADSRVRAKTKDIRVRRRSVELEAPATATESVVRCRISVRSGRTSGGAPDRRAGAHTRPPRVVSERTARAGTRVEERSHRAHRPQSSQPTTLMPLVLSRSQFACTLQHASHTHISELVRTRSRQVHVPQSSGHRTSHHARTQADTVRVASATTPHSTPRMRVPLPWPRLPHKRQRQRRASSREMPESRARCVERMWAFPLPFN